VLGGQPLGAAIAGQELDHRMLTHGPTLKRARSGNHGR
jgi:hypothetical protein